MNVKTSVFVICVEAIIYLQLYNLYDCPVRFANCLKLRMLCTLRSRDLVPLALAFI